MLSDIKEATKKHDHIARTRIYDYNKDFKATIEELNKRAFAFSKICRSSLLPKQSKALRDALFELNYIAFVSNDCDYSLFPDIMEAFYVSNPLEKETEDNTYREYYKMESDYYCDKSYELLTDFENKYDITLGTSRRKRFIIEKLKEQERLKNLYY